MRYSVRIEKITASHVTLRVFVNGASAGLLTFTHREALDFAQRIGLPDITITTEVQP